MVDGFIAYQGPALKSPDYFEKIGFKMAKNTNPADNFMRILSVEYPVTEKS